MGVGGWVGRWGVVVEMMMMNHQCPHTCNQYGSRR